MTVEQESMLAKADVSQGGVRGLPQALRTTPEAIHLPEVQEMLRRLSEYKLGIFMPHRHDRQTDEFQPLPNEVVQVESGLEVSFQAQDEIANQADRFLPVGWFWHGGASTPAAVRKMAGDEKTGDTKRYVKHKMPKANQHSASCNGFLVGLIEGFLNDAYAGLVYVPINNFLHGRWAK